MMRLHALIGAFLFLILAGAAPAMAQNRIGCWDMTRAGQASMVGGSYLSQFSSAVTAAFPGMKLSPTSTLTSSYLSTLDVLIIVDGTGGNSATTPLSSAEQTALLNFVQAGGRALIFTDNDTFTSNASTVNNSYINPFGVSSTGTLNGNPFNVTVTNPAASPITNGFMGMVNSYYTGWPGWYNRLGSYASSLGTLDANGETALAVIPPGTINSGSGAVVLFSDSTYLYNGYWNSTMQALTLNAIAYAALRLSAISPTKVNAGGPANLIVKGAGFVNGATVYFNGSPVSTTYISAIVLKAAIPASDLTSPGTASITVTNPGVAPTPAKSLKIVETTVQVLPVSVSKDSSGNYVVTVNLKNTGYLTASSLTIKKASLNGIAPTTTLPITLGNLAAGSSTSVNLTFPASSGASGSTVALKVSGSFTKGTFSGSVKVTLP